MAAYTDDFNRANADNPGVVWDEIAGDFDISSNTLILAGTGLAVHCLIYVGATLELTQFVKVKLVSVLADFPQIYLRWTDDASPHYTVELRDGVQKLYRWGSLDTDPVFVGGANIALAANDEVGIGITGTGNDTIVRLWKNPTGIPTAADSWNGVAATATIVDNPTSPVDTGSRVGIGGYCATGSAYDDFGAYDLSVEVEESEDSPSKLGLGLGTKLAI